MVYGYKVKRIIGIGDKKNTKSQINQQVIKNIEELKIRNRNKNLLEALPEGIGLVEVLGFFKSISASLNLGAKNLPAFGNQTIGNPNSF